MVAPTICWAAFGTKERALRMKFTRQRCHEAPCTTASMAFLILETSVGVAGDQPHPREPPPHQRA
jgi:hypothetical protein